MVHGPLSFVLRSISNTSVVFFFTSITHHFLNAPSTLAPSSILAPASQILCSFTTIHHFDIPIATDASFLASICKTFKDRLALHLSTYSIFPVHGLCETLHPGHSRGTIGDAGPILCLEPRLSRNTLGGAIPRARQRMQQHHTTSRLRS